MVISIVMLNYRRVKTPPANQRLFSRIQGQPSKCPFHPPHHDGRTPNHPPWQVVKNGSAFLWKNAGYLPGRWSNLMEYEWDPHRIYGFDVVSLVFNGIFIGIGIVFSWDLNGPEWNFMGSEWNCPWIFMCIALVCPLTVLKHRWLNGETHHGLRRIRQLSLPSGKLRFAIENDSWFISQNDVIMLV